MLKKALTLTVAVLTITAGVGTRAIAADAAVAGETNPLHPAYAHFTARANVQFVGGTVEIAKNPLTPSYYQWNAAADTNARSIEIEFAINNPLHPQYKRS
jgi:hypothetical protein